MISFYKRSFLKLLTMLHKAKNDPYKNIQKWLQLQELILKKICYVEKRIREYRVEIKSLSAQRKNPKLKLSKEKSKILKENIEILNENIRDYKFIISVYKSIGDGIAFTFIDKFDIKIQAFKESPGFISGKTGLILEKKILRDAFKGGNIAILNDITSVLRYSDITLITNDGIFPIEAKTSNIISRRVKVQEQKAEKMFDYLRNDFSTNLFSDSSQPFHRVECLNPERNYVVEFNSLIGSAYKNGSDYIKFEDGFTCVASFEEMNNSIFNLAVTEQGLTKPFAFFLNMHKFEEQGYYPLSLLFSKPKFYYDFLIGKLNILFFIDFEIIKRKALEKGFVIEKSSKEDYAININSIDNNSPIKNFNMSSHYFFRSIMELISIEWLLQSAFDRFTPKM